MPMRWRWPPENWRGIAVHEVRRQADLGQQVARRARAARAALRTRPKTSRGSATMSAMLRRGLSEPYGILEDHLRAAGAARASRAPESAVMSVPSKKTLPARRLDQPQQQAAQSSTCRSRIRRRAPASRRVRPRRRRRRRRARRLALRGRTPRPRSPKDLAQLFGADSSGSVMLAIRRDGGAAGGRMALAEAETAAAFRGAGRRRMRIRAAGDRRRSPA